MMFKDNTIRTSPLITNTYSLINLSPKRHISENVNKHKTNLIKPKQLQVLEKNKYIQSKSEYYMLDKNEIHTKNYNVKKIEKENKEEDHKSTQINISLKHKIKSKHMSLKHRSIHSSCGTLKPDLEYLKKVSLISQNQSKSLSKATVLKEKINKHNNIRKQETIRNFNLQTTNNLVEENLNLFSPSFKNILRTDFSKSNKQFSKFEHKINSLNIIPMNVSQLKFVSKEDKKRKIFENDILRTINSRIKKSRYKSKSFK